MLLLAAALALAPSMTITSFNVRYGTANDGENRWELRRPRTFEVMRRYPADLWALQEALGFQVDELAQAVGKFGVVGVGRDDGKRAGEFSAILFSPQRFRLRESGTFWLSDTPETVASASWGNRVVRICTWAHFEDRRAGQSFYVFNTHLDHESQPAREKGVALILQRIRDRKHADPVLVTGDFNAGEENPAIAAVKKAGFRDTFRLLEPSAKEVGTFHGFGDKLGREKIDFVFADEGWEVRAARHISDRIDGRWPSDHLPVTATLALR